VIQLIELSLLSVSLLVCYICVYTQEIVDELMRSAIIGMTLSSVRLSVTKSIVAKPYILVILQQTCVNK